MVNIFKTFKKETIFSSSFIYSLGYKSFMLAIQNQISVLSKILATKVQHQQNIEHQQAVSASLKKSTTPVLSRSRKTSTNQDTSSQSGSSKEKSGNGSNSNIDNILSDTSNLSEVERQTNGNEMESGTVPESTGCIIS